MHYQPVENVGDESHIVQGPVPPPATVNDAFDDVFGADEEEHHHITTHSDIHRVQAEHSTAGYREGVNVGKQDTLQQGFDQGYTIGAAIGLQAGQILGTLEGIVEAVQGEDLTRMETLLQEARQDLSVEKLFSSEFWKSDGLPGYEMPDEQKQAKDGAACHPLVKKWIDIAHEQTRAWGINVSLLDESAEDLASAKKAGGEVQDLSGEAKVEDLLDW
ncbi:ABC1 domain-containing protein [Emericellopsis atlantica]|uniref:Protein YAE1 n=1 Tax=Emericellopsis atlantica TaxID=2614577 RepID=A0A9P7ZV54_9HYPO|nr:ABC1 domain-containing protein [Emericellopsis atlantica]KAG9258656.1 ABC1 domain-containing protein [Emericellopsis atlantica]